MDWTPDLDLVLEECDPGQVRGLQPGSQTLPLLSRWHLTGRAGIAEVEVRGDGINKDDTNTGPPSDFQLYEACKFHTLYKEYRMCIASL